MKYNPYQFRSGSQLSARSLFIWRMVQWTIWLVGLTIFICLVFFPSAGLTMFWNILIPVAPALLVFAPGLWRNICPLASTALLPRHLGFSGRKKLPSAQQSLLSFAGIILLYLLVPLRHAFFNTNGPATAALLLGMSALAIYTGFRFEWKSAWCSGLCPVHPVEKLYGIKPVISVPNAHCRTCTNCVVSCPDSTPGMHPAAARKNNWQKLSGLLMVGGFPGFVWGWFHVFDHHSIQSLSQLFDIYIFPLSGTLISLFIYLLLKEILPAKFKSSLVNIFAASAVSFYYWYRIPSLFGFGYFKTDGVLIDLSHTISPVTLKLIIISLSILFFWWIVLHTRKTGSWLIRPAFESSSTK
jgi:hypothetical protein